MERQLVKREQAIRYSSREDELSGEIISAAIEVHRCLGPGLLESTYEECLCYELSERRFKLERQMPLPVIYKGRTLEAGYRLDIVVENLVVLELKVINCFAPIHTAQLLTYLKLSKLKLGMLINFNVSVLRSGLKRVVNEL